MKLEELKRIHNLSMGNIPSIQKSEKCGCFYCKKIYKANEIVDYINEKSYKTALCPYCYIDSVLCDYDIEITPEILDEMFMYWFKEN